MSYWKSHNKNLTSLDNFGLNKSNNNATQMEFYELEMGIVLDIILDDKHPFITNGNLALTTVDVDHWPVSVGNSKASYTDVNYSLIGKALIRPLVSGKYASKDTSIWAYPLENNITEYPLINETVILSIYNDRVYYSKKINYHNWTNNNLDFSIDSNNSKNTDLFTNNPITGAGKSVTNWKGNSGFVGFAGKYFVANNRIRGLQRYEGDLALESRFGQSIRFTSYDEIRSNDVGSSTYSDYNNNGGNPMLLIRNRQRPILKEGESISLRNSPSPATIYGTSAEKNVGGYITENINHDGSSIQLTSGLTISKWVTTCYKHIFGTGEEVSGFNGTSNFKYPVLNGDQIVINTDRLILAARYGELLQYSKKRMGLVTDGEFTIDAHDQVVITTNNKTVINSPVIYLGEYNQSNEPAMLGQTTVNWLYNMCNLMIEHTHWYQHGHENRDAGTAVPNKTQAPVEIQQIISMRDSLNQLMSRRVFITGGGFAPGQNGGNIPNGTPPVSINTISGEGVPGGWNVKTPRLM